MAARKFKANGREYSDTPAGWLAAAKDEWAIELKRAGHRVTLRKYGNASYRGTCKNCDGYIVLGSASASTDMRSRIMPGRHARRCRGRS
jgi:hypothetical protein